jgi:glutamyl-tRNA synthetase
VQAGGAKDAGRAKEAMSEQVRVRFAPSPTGYLHVGGARTALYNWLFARHAGGTFILRIEDTDVERSTQEATRAIFDALRWLGLDWDEGPETGGPAGPYRQLERMDLYREHGRRLAEAGRVYPCTCTAEEREVRRKAALAAKRPPRGLCPCRERGPDAGRPAALRFAVPPAGRTVWRDVIHGDVGFDHTEIDDFVILRADGLPIYNFAAVVDDALMRITHVIRGDDHISNTPRQILLYEALGYPVPAFAHIPMILGADRTRLSKRHGATSVEAYRDLGYLPEAVVNYLVRLGWAHGDQETFSRDEMVRHFTLEKVGKTAAVFDQKKLDWLNGHYLRQADPQALAAGLGPFWRAAGVDDAALAARDGAWRARVAALFRERARTLADLAQASLPLFRDAVTVDPGAAAKHLTPEGRDRLAKILPEVEALEPFTAAGLEALYRAQAEAWGLKLVQVAQPTRVAVLGVDVSPPLFPILELLGKAESVRRMRAATTQ